MSNLNNCTETTLKRENVTFVSYNCYGFKSNINYIKKLIKKFDICFFCEHWLSLEEESLFKELSFEHNFFFKSSYSISSHSRKGRPFGGVCWSIKKNINVESINFFDTDISTINIKINHIEIIFHGVWLPFDNGREDKFACFKSNLSLLKSQYSFYRDIPQFVIGDFNASTTRYPATRLDKIFKEFLELNKLNNVLDSCDAFKLDYTYKKGDYEARIDHIVINEKSKRLLKSAEILNDIDDLSDHRPVSGIIQIDQDP